MIMAIAEPVVAVADVDTGSDGDYKDNSSGSVRRDTAPPDAYRWRKYGRKIIGVHGKRARIACVQR